MYTKVLKEGLATEICDVDLTSLTEPDFDDIKAAFDRSGLVFIRDQSLDPDQHIRFAERWGDININRFFTPVPDHPRIAEVRKEPEQQQNIGGGWHTDHSYDIEPALGSILYAREVPEHGGDTLFASMYLAFEALSDGLKDTLRSLRAVHSSRHVFGASAMQLRSDAAERLQNAELATQDAIHPVVIRHPRSGKEALYVNPGFTLHFEGWTADESRPLLEMLYRHASRPEFCYRWHWQPGSLAFWDNRATWHYAVNDYHGERRLMHRITLEGGPLAA